MREPAAPQRAGGDIRLRRLVLVPAVAPDTIEASRNKSESVIKVSGLKPNQAKRG
jgi:hypothetical protein